MNPRRLVALAGLALVVLAAAWWLGQPHGLPRDPDFGMRVLPGLAAHLDEVDQIRLVGPGNARLVTLSRDHEHWRVVEANYRADARRVRQLLIALGELHVVEAKTRDPARHPVLGVEDPSAAGATSVRVELGGLHAPTALIVGHAAGAHGTYVRVAASTEALEAQPALEIGRSSRDWLARTIIDLAAARVASVEVNRPDGAAWRAERGQPTDAHFTVGGLPKGKELSSAGAADALASALGSLELDQVRASSPASGRVPRTTVRCYDGLVLTISAPAAAEHWIHLEARYDAELAARHALATPKDSSAADAVRAEAARLNAELGPYDFQLAAYRFDGLFRPLAELLRH